MSQGSNRRDFLKQTGTFAAGGLWLARSGAKALAYEANEKLNVACIGVGGKGQSDMQGAAGRKGGGRNSKVPVTYDGENIFAICDVDDRRLDEAAKEFPKAKRFNDYRRLLRRARQVDRRRHRLHARPLARPRGRWARSAWASTSTARSR